MSPAPKCCANCAWWRRQEPQIASAERDPGMSPRLGTCVLLPPYVIPAVQFGLAETVFPVTNETRFCGEWLQREGDDGESEERDAADDTVVPLRPAA